MLLWRRFGFGLVLGVAWGAAGNDIGEAGATAVAEALKTNSTLSSLNLECECVVCGLAMIVGAVVRRAGGSGWRGEGVAATVGRMAIGRGGGRQGVGVRARLVWWVAGMWRARWGWCGVCGGALCGVWWGVQGVVGVAE